jgi:hypothetical protein
MRPSCSAISSNSSNALASPRHERARTGGCDNDETPGWRHDRRGVREGGATPSDRSDRGGVARRSAAGPCSLGRRSHQHLHAVCRFRKRDAQEDASQGVDRVESRLRSVRAAGAERRRRARHVEKRRSRRGGRDRRDGRRDGGLSGMRRQRPLWRLRRRRSRLTAGFCVPGLVGLLLTGLGGTASAGQAEPPASTMVHLRAGFSRSPTPADFVGYPSCMIYALGADTRIRVRAARASTFCTTLSRQLSSSGTRWSLKPRRLRHILSPICHFADPSGQVELEVIDAAAKSSRGQRICAGLVRAGWFDLSPP